MTGRHRPQLSIGLRSFSAEDPGGWDHLRRQAVVADTVGIDRVAVSDHVVFGDDLAAYADPRQGGREGGRQPTGPDGHWLEPITVLTWIAGQTERVRLATNIVIAGLRRPVVLAKQLATLDVLSGGRVDLGVGVGWQRAEYEAAGLDFDDRGRLLDHTLEVCTALWGEERSTFADDLLSFEGIHQMPKPLQPGGVPIWVAGTVNPRMVARLARFGTGWIPWGPAIDDPVTAVAEVHRLLADRGRADADQLQVTATLPVIVSGGPAGDDVSPVDVEATLDAAARLVDAGITDLRLRWWNPDHPERDADRLELLVSAVDGAFGRRDDPA